MRLGRTSSRIISFIGLLAVLCLGIGLFAVVLRGEPSPVRMAVREPASFVETAFLSRDDVSSADRLERALARMNYRLEDIAEGMAEVPPLFLAQIPADMEDMDQTERRKALFLKVMLPLVLAVDEEIAADRARLQELASRRTSGKPLADADAQWLAALAKRYEVEDGNLKTLMARVDVVPPSLALAQAAEESGWGTSALVRRSRNLFGHTVDLPGDAVAMRNFASLYEAVRTYVHNLNTHKAYEELRRSRATARARGLAPDGHALVSALRAYSERGDAYVSTIRSLIKRNDLDRYDRARLGHALPGRLAQAS